MSGIQNHPDPSPFENPTVVAAAIGAFTRADAMGLLSRKIARLDRIAIMRLGKELADAGLSLELQAAANADPERLSALLTKINAALDESPVPDREWRAVERVLGLEGRWIKYHG